SYLKALIPERTGMINFLLEVIQQRNFDQEKIMQSIENAENEMLQNGIVAVGDICNTTNTISQKTKRRIYYHNFIEATGFDESSAPQRFEAAKSVFQQFAQYYSLPVFSNSIVPHAPYSVSSALFKKIVDFPGNYLLTMHNQEHQSENDFFKSKQGDFLKLYEALKINIDHFEQTGKSSLQSVLPFFYPNQKVIFVHNIATNEDDLKAIKNLQLKIENIFFCLCPNANLYINGALPNIELFMNNNCNIVLGTDSLASNHQLNILSELKTLKGNFPQVDLSILLQWATYNGAKALDIDEVFGNFETGKKPGVINISKNLSSVKRII
ncbi:MAG: amidohydrolase family protein, partial [Bacteroidota bacterium]